MKKTLVFIGLSCLLCVSTLAQTRNRVFDNFDTSRGIEVAAPVVAARNTSTQDKKLIKKTVQTQASAPNNVGLKNTAKIKSQPMPKLMMSIGSSLDNFTTGDSVIDSYIVDSCLRNGIDPLLIYAQMHQESSFKSKATSNKGARGLMQLMPGTAMRFGVTNIYDPRQNIEGGVKYMRWLMDTFKNDVNLVLAGYNAGEGAVMKYGNQIPPYAETQEYVRRITARYNSIRNPGAVKAVKIPVAQIAKLEKKAPAPLTVYEPNALTVRLPDGRMRLVNQ